MRTILILFLAVLIAGCGASNVQVIKPVNGDVKPLLRPELQKGQCFNFAAWGGGGDTLTKKSALSSDECNLTVDEVVYRLTVLCYIGKETYTAEAGEKHVIAKRAKGNKDVEVTANYYYELDGGVRGIEVLINDFTDPNYDKAAAPGWAVKAIYRAGSDRALQDAQQDDAGKEVTNRCFLRRGRLRPRLFLCSKPFSIPTLSSRSFWPHPWRPGSGANIPIPLPCNRHRRRPPPQRRHSSPTGRARRKAG
jgi:hypothetical protein